MRLTALIPLSMALLAAPLVQAENLPKAIQQMQAKGAEIKGGFDAPNGLRGYAAQYQNNGRLIARYCIFCLHPRHLKCTARTSTSRN